MIDFSKLSATSAASGFKNYNLVPATQTGVIPAQILSANQVVTNTISISLDNTNAVSLVKLQYATLDTFWRQLFGITSSTFVPFVDPYQLESIASYVAGNLIITTYAINQSGGSFSLPEQVINVRARLYKSPFSN